MEWCLRAMFTSWKPRPLSEGVLSLIILVPPLALRAMDSSYRRSSPWSSSLFLLAGGPHNANPAHWLPAYCAHAFHNFSQEHLSVLANPDTLASFNTEVVDLLLNSETSKAQEYLQGLLATADDGFIPVLRRRPVPLTDGRRICRHSLKKMNALFLRGLKNLFTK